MRKSIRTKRPRKITTEAMNRDRHAFKRIIALVLTTLVLALTACGTIVADSVDIAGGDRTVTEGESFKLAAVASGDVTWNSSDTSVALVNGLGTVSAVGAGTAVITATCGKANDSVTVTVLARDVGYSIAFDITKRTIAAGESFKINPTLSKAGDVIWSSSKSKIASVSDDGTVTALSAGETVITGIFGTASATCKVTVTAAPPPPPTDTVSLDITSKTIEAGGSFKITATTSASGTVAWSTSNSAVATVSNGTVTAVAAGSAAITATFGTAKATCNVTVTAKQEPPTPTVDPDDVALELKTNAEVVANPNTWYYFAAGNYVLNKAVINKGTITFSFDKMADNTYQLRYQPFSVGDEYTATFKIEVTAACTVVYGVDGKTVKFGSAGSASITYEGKTTNNPFMIQLKPVNLNSPITLIVSDIVFTKKQTELLLKNKYADYFRMGVAVQNGTFTSYADQIKHFNSYTPENDMKWRFLEATEGKYTYTNADNIVSKAKSGGAIVRGHTLVWYKSLPTWIKTKATTKQAALDLIDAHIDRTMKHFGADIAVWDVVNEALRNEVSASQLSTGSIYRTGGITEDTAFDWYAMCGEDFIKRAFAKAAAVRAELGLTSNDMKLYYNDYGLINPYKRAACVKLVQMLQDAGVPIDGVGMQMHYRLSTYLDDKTGFLTRFEDSVKAFTELGIDVQITELDVRIYANDNDPPYTAAQIEQAFIDQGEMYGEILKICRKYATPYKAGAGRITNVTTWGISDSGTAWDTSSHSELPFIFDTAKNAKPALAAMLEF